MDSRALCLSSKHALSLTTIASELAPTGRMNQPFEASSATSFRDNSIIFALRAAA
jgi:hypothetical protein